MADGLHQRVSTNTVAAPAQAAVTETPNVRLSGLKVMVIDDSKTIRRSAEILLQQAGCEVVLVGDGFDALGKITTHRPDVIFVDVVMPRLDGYQTCALIKRSGVYKHTPVVMLTSKDNLFDRARGRDVGSNQYLTKPFTKETLLRAVEAHVPVRQDAREPLRSQPGR